MLLSSCGRLIVARQSEHEIMLDRAGVVMEAIRQVFAVCNKQGIIQWQR